MEVCAVAHRYHVQVGWSVDFQQRDVGGGVRADHGGREVAVVVEGDFESLGLGYHVVVGDYIAVGADDDA